MLGIIVIPIGYLGYESLIFRDFFICHMVGECGIVWSEVDSNPFRVFIWELQW